MSTRKSYKFSDLKDKLGRFRTQSLFWEFAFLNNLREEENVLDPIWTIKDYDIEKEGIVYPSLKQIYMSYDHIPGFEYDFAMEVFNSWDHWVKLTDSSNASLRTEFKAWREELEIKIKANAIRAVMQKSKMDDAQGFNAAKYLADKGYAPTRGRPSKEEVEREKKIQAGVSKELESDMERLGLKVINGTK
jgi:hypothetical protein